MTQEVRTPTEFQGKYIQLSQILILQSFLIIATVLGQFCVWVSVLFWWIFSSGVGHQVFGQTAVVVVVVVVAVEGW